MKKTTILLILIFICSCTMPSVILKKNPVIDENFQITLDKYIKKEGHKDIYYISCTIQNRGLKTILINEGKSATDKKFKTFMKDAYLLPKMDIFMEKCLIINSSTGPVKEARFYFFYKFIEPGYTMMKTEIEGFENVKGKAKLRFQLKATEDDELDW